MSAAYEMARLRQGNSSKIYEALAQAQGQFPDIPKTKQGHGYKYAPMGAILKCVRPILSKHGLAIIQHMDGAHMVTIICHADGGKIETRFPLRQIEGRMNAMQAMGAVSTYASRYGLCLALGIAADEDADAHENGVLPPTVTEDFHSNGHDGAGISVRGAKVPKNASAEDKAKAYTDRLIEQLQNVKTAKGMPGVWDRNEDVIDRLSASYPSLYANLVDAYETRLEALQEDEEA